MILLNAFTFLRLIKYDISIDGLVRYLQADKWKVIFFNTEEGDQIVEQLGLKDEAARKQAFTYFRNAFRFVFIDNNVDEEGQQALLLHEIGHIRLKHLSDCINPDSTQCQVEANQYVAMVLQLHRNRRLYKRCVIGAAALLVALAVTISSTMAYNAYRTVYVTPSGSKYHTNDCSTVDYDTANSIPIYKAKKSYAPCELCRP